LRVCSDLLSQAADVRTAYWQAGMNFGTARDGRRGNRIS
jgi:hypothetical protein